MSNARTPSHLRLFLKILLFSFCFLPLWNRIGDGNGVAGVAAAPEIETNGGNTLALLYEGSGGWWSGSQYAASLATGRVVSGDFDGDGKTDIAAMYDYGSNTVRWHVWLSTGSSFDYYGNSWWTASQYAASLATGRVVSGDYNADGRDDIAALYDYGNNTVRWHVWLSTGSAFDYSGNQWWSGTQYAASLATGRVVSGDFNADGLDDIAAMYNYGSNTVRWHVWLSSGSTFDYQSNSPGWWYATQYAASLATGRVASGDFNLDGLDDIAAMYDYGGNTVRWHVWLSTGSAFDYQSNTPGWWYQSGYAPERATERVVSGDFNGDGRDEVTAMYDYSGTTTRWHGWLSTGSAFDYQGSDPGWWTSTQYAAPLATGRVVSGDFDGDTISDVAALYDYGSNSVTWHVWLSNAPNRQFIPVVKN